VESDESLPDKLAFDYIKSDQFRVIHADGVWGGLTSKLKIFMTVWSERPPIPTHVVHSVDSDGSLGAEILDERISRSTDSVREVEAGIVLDIGLAKAMIRWLEAKVKSAEEVISSIRKQEPNDDKTTDA
jgi:hypothetical protein